MQTTLKTHFLLYLATFLTSAAGFVEAQETIVRPARGGGLDTNAPMIHVDIFYDFDANVMHATVDDSHGIPTLTPLPSGCVFDTSLTWSVLSGKAYNMQYAWNPGGIFNPPEGGAVWIERLSASPGLENYDGPGNKNENPPRPWTPILGTDGSSLLWQWYGRMAHNAFAVDASVNDTTVSASYRVFFGDAVTGSPDAFRAYDDAVVELRWTIAAIPEPRPWLLSSCGLLLLGTAWIRRSRGKAVRERAHPADIGGVQ
jgi:hypothetical protein